MSKRESILASPRARARAREFDPKVEIRRGSLFFSKPPIRSYLRKIEEQSDSVSSEG